MKKTYIQPSTEVHKMTTTRMIALSDPRELGGQGGNYRGDSYDASRNGGGWDDEE